MYRVISLDKQVIMPGRGNSEIGQAIYSSNHLSQLTDFNLIRSFYCPNKWPTLLSADVHSTLLNFWTRLLQNAQNFVSSVAFLTLKSPVGETDGVWSDTTLSNNIQR